MEAKAKARFVRVTPQKARRVVDLIRGKQAGEAVAVLKFAPQSAAEPVLKTVQSAIANAVEGAKRNSERLDEADLYISEVFVDEVLVRGLGIDLIQGYLFSKPVSIASLRGEASVPPPEGGLNPASAAR